MRGAVAEALVMAGAAVQLLGVLGVALVPDPLDRVHFLAPALPAAALLTAAVLVQESFSLIGLSALLVLAVLALTGPVLAHVTARAVHAAWEEPA